MTDDELLARAKVIDDKLAQGLASLIERHRAERAEWDAHAGMWKATLDEQRAEVEAERKLAEDWQRLHGIVTRRAEAAEAALAAAEERVREECARIADNWAAAHGQTNWIGAAIRARKP